MNNTKLTKTDLKLIEMLPTKFNKRQAAETVRLLGLNKRYFENFTRKKLFLTHFERIFHGEYQKISG